jgi:pimeloyl-ACP methyl ester carboxylesterase
MALERAGRPNQELERWCTVDGHTFRYLVTGSGPPIILLHGLLGFSFSWRRNLEALSQCGTLFAIDALGAGYSDHPHLLESGLEAQAERILGLMDALGIESAAVAGNSHGGGVAMMMAGISAERGRQRVTRLLLADPVHPWSEYEWLQRVLIDCPPALSLFGPMLLKSKLLQIIFLRRLYGDPRRLTPATIEGYTAALHQNRTLEYGMGVVKNWRDDLRRLEELSYHLSEIPAMVIWGTEDHAVKIESAARLCRVFQHCEFIPVPGVGHMPMEEAPQIFNPAAKRFLSSECPGGHC